MIAYDCLEQKLEVRTETVLFICVVNLL